MLYVCVCALRVWVHSLVYVPFEGAALPAGAGPPGWGACRAAHNRTCCTWCCGLVASLLPLPARHSSGVDVRLMPSSARICPTPVCMRSRRTVQGGVTAVASKSICGDFVIWSRKQPSRVRGVRTFSGPSALHKYKILHSPCPSQAHTNKKAHSTFLRRGALVGLSTSGTDAWCAYACDQPGFRV